MDRLQHRMRQHVARSRAAVAEDAVVKQVVSRIVMDAK